YWHMNKYADAEKWYRQAITSSYASPLDKLHYAEVLQAEGKCTEATPYFDSYLRSSPSDEAAKNMRASCNPEKPFKKADGFYYVKKLDLGFVGSSFSPTKFGKDLLVTAS